MSQIHNPECIHDSDNKKVTLVEDVDFGLKPLTALCPECIDFIKSSSTFKIISESKEKKN